MNFYEEALKILKKYFGYSKFRNLQAEIIQNVLEEKDTIVLMPTGIGKSITFQIPSLIFDGLTVVISPLIALMKDQVDGLKSSGIPADFINSSQTGSERKKIMENVLSKKIKLLYVSPEKLMTKDFYLFLKKVKISLFAVDEAHCISQWGHSFRPEYTKLKFLKHYFEKVPIIALTATADKITARDIIKQLKLENPAKFISSFDRPNLSLKVLIGRDRFTKIANFIKDKPKQSGIIYCLSRKSTESLAKRLNVFGIKAGFYHAGMMREERSKVQEDFIKDNIHIICATIAFGMGIDKSNIRFVIHYNMPKNIESYYQEIGRAGRDGLKSETFMFYSISDVITYKYFIDKEENKNREIEISKLQRIQEFAEAQTCRRKVLLSYFGEFLEKDCGNCDVCKNPPKYFDGTILTQKALSAIYRTKESIGMTALIDFLRGAKRKDFFTKDYHKIKTYGVGKNLRFDEWQSVILQLLNQGLIEIAYDKNHVLQLTEASNKVLFENKKINLVTISEIKSKNQKIVSSKKTITQKEKNFNELFEKLRKLRKEIADNEKVPPYVIFNDLTLKELSDVKPTKIEDLTEISGIGEHKKNKYGKVFIYEIINFITDKILDGVNIKGGTNLLTFKLYKKGLSVDEIARKRDLKSATIFSHLAKFYEDGEDIDIFRILKKEEIDKIIYAIENVKVENGLKPVFDFLNQEISYGKIKLALIYLLQKK